MRTLTTGQLAKKAKVNVQTVRYYERRGLLPEPPRRESGYRQYPQETAARIEFIKRAQVLGFTLTEISELLSMRAGTDATCAEVKKTAEAKVADIEEKVRDLQGMKEALVRLITACEERGPTSECPILDALDNRWTTGPDAYRVATSTARG
ncbi:MAG: MerR family DNA-binding protein [Dehalococcoidia bacterium]|nr:MerR family DNA-binding protein [Dehalococcoidia bacterium]